MDETKDPKDTSQSGGSSVGTKGTSEPQPFTKESQEKAVSDALSVAGRNAKTLSDKTAEVERLLTNAKKISDDTKVAQEKWQKNRDEAEREAFKDDTEALKSLEEKQRQRAKDAELTERERTQKEKEDSHQVKVTDDLERIRVFNRTQMAAEIAVAKGVNLDAILKLTKEDTREAMEATAELLPKKEVEPLLTDSSTTIGGEKTPDQKLKERFPKMI